jgi:hypothetical protein
MLYICIFIYKLDLTQATSVFSYKSFSPKEVQGMFQNILLAEYHGTFHATPLTKRLILFVNLQKQVWLKEITSTNYVCAYIGAADSCSNMRMSVRQKPNPFTICFKIGDWQTFLQL